MFCCITNFQNWCRSFPSPASVACRADSAPQPENLGWPRHLLGLAAHLWGPGMPCWDDIQRLILAGDCFCCPSAVLDDRSTHTLSMFTILSIFIKLSIVMAMIMILSKKGQASFHVYAQLQLAHASCLHMHGFNQCDTCMQILLCASVAVKCPGQNNQSINQ